MAQFLFPLLLIALGVFGLLNHDLIQDQWSAMYPDDPARQAALTRCAAEDSMFNRFTPAGRTACYQKYLQVELPAAAPGIAVSIPGAPTTSPTHVMPHPPAIHNNSGQR